MIISNNKKPNLETFSSLVHNATEHLNEQARSNEGYYLERSALRLEDDVFNALSECAEGTPFEDTIVKVSGQRFPDIVAGKYYGVEVKSSHADDWVALGGSVNESTRVDNVDRIFITYGKLISPIKFVSRPYEDCLSDVVVTHYPRYKIDMRLESGKTIFDKMHISYDNLRKSEYPVRKIVEYYKKRLKKGESLWWIDTGSDDASSTERATMSVKLWKTLKKDDKNNFMISGFAFFPEILSNKNDKYERYSLWLASNYGIVSNSLRDTFTAGGQGQITLKSRVFNNVPQSLLKMKKFKKEISYKIESIKSEELKEFWRVKSIESNRIGQWIGIISNNSHIGNIREILSFIYN